MSVVIAVVASCAALWLALNLTVAWQMATAAVVMGVAVTGMHYTGMVAARFAQAPGGRGAAGGCGRARSDRLSTRGSARGS